MAKFQMGVTLSPYIINDTARVGGAAGANKLQKEDNGKLLKLAGDSRYDLCAVGDRIEGVLTVAGDLVAIQDGYQLGSVRKEGRFVATADGSQAAGTGSLAIGDVVVCGTPLAAGTALTFPAGPKVRKATNQPGGAITIADNVQATLQTALTAAADQIKNAQFSWRVVAILSGTGAVGDRVLVERA